MQIQNLDAKILRDPVTAEETVLVTVRSDEGLVGYGEGAALPAAVKAVVESEAPNDGWDAGIRTLLIGADPADPARLWRYLRDNTFWSCRSGIGHVALAAVDMALWDLAGKIQGKPAWQLMGERENRRLVPYATLYHGAGSTEQTVIRTLEALEVILDRGYRAVKVESMDMNIPDTTETIGLVAAVRDRIGPDFPLLLDMGYRWQRFDEAESTVKELDQFSLFALEAPFPPHRLTDYQRLADAIGTPLATGDQLTAASDYEPLLAAGALRYVQGGAARTGVSDMGVLARAAEDRGVQFMPWGWVPTGLATWANLHRAVVHRNVPLVEYRAVELYPEGLLRAAVASPEPELVDGEFAVPTRPGLGVEVDQGLVERLRVG